MKNTMFSIPEATLAELEVYAGQHGITRSAAIRYIVTRFLFVLKTRTAQAIAAEQVERETPRAPDPWFEPISALLQRQENASMAEIRAELGLEKPQWSRLEDMRAAACLKILGYRRKQFKSSGLTHYRYCRFEVGENEPEKRREWPIL